MSEQVLDAALRPTPVAPVFRLSVSMRLAKVGLNGTLLAGIVLLGLVTLGAIIAPLLTPYDPIAQHLDEAFRAPFSPNHPLGTDNFGRDMWSRIIFSTRLDLQIGVVCVLFPFLFGCFMGIA